MNKKMVKITIKKELRSIFRDKKTIALIFVFPLLIAFFIFLLSSTYETSINDKEIYDIAINYELTDIEKKIIKENQLKTKYYDSLDKMEKDFKNSKVSAYVYYDKEKNTYTIYSDEGMKGMSASSFITSYLDTYNTYLGNKYLLENNINPEDVYNNFTIKTELVEGENYILQTVLSLAFTYVIIAIAMASSSLATSATAVEKEQGTLETLLTFPVTSKELITGKYLATVIMSLFASLFGYLITLISLVIAKGKYKVYEDINLFINPENIIIGILICLAASLLISGLAILLTANSKSYKEAQMASQVLTMITIVPMFISMLNISIISKLYYVIPILSHVQILMDIFTTKINYSNIFLCLLSSIIISIIIIDIIIKKFKSEKVLFG
ncbi:abc-type na+ efflux pump permease component-like protein [Mycoplasma sp. CAG:877]|nr:abc-type na+ efflux pump permease component-like protein [Mycoplasma sp. CAG:877]